MRYEDSNISIDSLDCLKIEIESLQDATDLIDFAVGELKRQFVAENPEMNCDFLNIMIGSDGFASICDCSGGTGKSYSW